MLAAEEIIIDCNKDLGVALDSLKETLDRKAVKTAQTKVELGPGQKRQLEEHQENPRRLKWPHNVLKWYLN